MNGMKQIILITWLLVPSVLMAQAPKEYPIETKKFYTQVFDASAQRKLARADRKAARAEELQIKADERYHKAKAARQKSRSQNNPDLLKEADRLTFWADFHQRRASRKVFKANKLRLETYQGYIKQAQLKDNSREARKGNSLKGQAEGLNARAKRQYNSLPQDGHEKALAMQKVDSLSRAAVEKMELAFGVYKKESEALKMAFPEKPADEEKNPGDYQLQVREFEVQYNPNADPKLYKSIAGKLIPLLGLSNQDRNRFRQANQNINSANAVYRSVNKQYARIYALEKAIDIEKNKARQEQMKSDKQLLQGQAFSDMLRYANTYLAANVTKYQILRKHVGQSKLGNNEFTIAQAQLLLNQATALKDKADQLQSESSAEQFRFIKYRQLMEANLNMLLALQNTEAALAQLLGVQTGDPTNVVDVFDVVDNEVTTGGETTSVQEDDQSQSKLSFETITRQYTFSKDAPEPKEYKGDEGLLFRVQAGIMKQLPKKALNVLTPAYAEEYADNPFSIFYLGALRTIEAGQVAEQKVKDKLFNDAFLVAYYKGERISLKRARQLIASGKLMSEAEYNRLKKQELHALEYGEPLKTDRVAVAGKLENTKGLHFTVQLGIFDQRPLIGQVGGIDSVYEGSTVLGPRYTHGLYPDFTTAKEKRNELFTRGVRKAFVIAYNDGAWLEINRARDFYGLTQDESMAGKDIIYRIQIGAFSERGRFKKLRERIPLTEIPNSQGLITYNVGEFTDYSQALARRDELLAEGIEGYVVAYRGDAKVALTEARKTTEEKQQDQPKDNTPEQAENKKATEQTIVFHVQVGAYRNPLSDDEKAAFTSKAGEQPLSVNRDAEGKYLYSLGRFDYYEQAVEYQKQLEEKDVIGYVVAYKGDEKISLEAARKAN